MRITVQLTLEKKEINLDYRRLMISYLKKSLERSNPIRYEEMYGRGVTKEKNFASDIRLGYAKYLSDYIQLQNDEITWVIVTPDYLLGIDIYNALLAMKNVSYPAYNENRIRIRKINVENHKSYDAQEAVIKFCSGLCVRRHIKGEKDKYFFYDEEGFNEQLVNNIGLQLRDTNINDLSEFKLEPIQAKRVYSKTYGIVIPNSVGLFRLSGENKLINYLFQAGMGSKRNSGFGLFEILE